MLCFRSVFASYTKRCSVFNNYHFTANRKNKTIPMQTKFTTIPIWLQTRKARHSKQPWVASIFRMCTSSVATLVSLFNCYALRISNAPNQSSKYLIQNRWLLILCLLVLFSAAHPDRRIKPQLMRTRHLWRIFTNIRCACHIHTFCNTSFIVLISLLFTIWRFQLT